MCDGGRPIDGTWKPAVEAELASVEEHLWAFPDGVGRAAVQDYMEALRDALSKIRED
jgi:hypothetical protein